MNADGFAAVLWDMDGTLVDTEPHWIAAQQAFLQRRGLPPLSAVQEQRLVGASPTTTAAVFAEQGATGDPGDIAKEVTAGVIAAVSKQIDWRPGALELLVELAEAGVPMALVTNSSRALVDAVCSHLPAQAAFREYVTSEDVQEGKPSPEPFLLGAKRLGVPPHRCLVLEDSINGLGGALAADCTVIGIPHGVDIPHSEQYLRLDTLRGITAADLTALYRDFHQRPSPAAS